MEKTQIIPTLHLISGSKLDDISFVNDYIIFRFGGLIFAALADPILIQHGQALISDQLGYKDALFKQLGQAVTSTLELPERLEIVLEGEDRIVVPLDAAYPPGPEMATLSGKGQFIASWLRTGVSPL
jgi:hypothetical protein